jgi:hypothetical protein
VGQDTKEGRLELDIREVPTMILTSLATIATGKETTTTPRLLEVELVAEIVANAWS